MLVYNNLLFNMYHMNITVR